MNDPDALHFKVVGTVFVRRRVGVVETGRGRLMAQAMSVPAWESINLALGDEIHVLAVGSFVDGRDGVYEVAFRPTPPRVDPKYAERHREHMWALVSLGTVVAVDGPSRVLSPSDIRAAADANALPPGTPVDRHVDRSPGLVTAEGIAGKAADMLGEAGAPTRMTSRERTADTPARAVVTIEGHPVTIVANDFDYAMVRVPASIEFPDGSGRIEGRERVARFPDSRDAWPFVEALVEEALKRMQPSSPKP